MYRLVYKDPTGHQTDKKSDAHVYLCFIETKNLFVSVLSVLFFRNPAFGKR